MIRITNTLSCIKMKRIVLAALLIAAVGIVNAAQAQNANPAGTWKWTVQTNNGQSRESTLTLRLEDGKLAGELAGGMMMGRRFGGGANAGGNAPTNAPAGPPPALPISEATWSTSGDFTFKVVRQGPNGQSFTTTYKGKITGNTLTGTIASSFNGQERTQEWTATRQ
jgi:hypothetical protein